MLNYNYYWRVEQNVEYHCDVSGSVQGSAGQWEEVQLCDQYA